MLGNAKSIIGKTVTGVIARPAPGGGEMLLMLQFSDGSCQEFVSPTVQRQLRRAIARRPERPEKASASQLSIFPLDGDLSAAAA